MGLPAFSSVSSSTADPDNAVWSPGATFGRNENAREGRREVVHLALSQLFREQSPIEKD
jgi:hypothetical protein